MANTKQWSKSGFRLNNGNTIPAVGLGTWQSAPKGVAEAVKTAIQAGYRHIDTAFGYGNEADVGRGIRESGVPREEIWITTKLDNPWHKRVDEAIDKSLKALGVDYVDLFLIHWPASLDANDTSKVYSDWDFRDTWREMQKLPASGRVRNIGVSNFSIKHLEELFASPDFKTVPAVNQIELHPYCPSPKLLKYLKEKDIHPTAYSCLGSASSPMHDDATLKKIAAAKEKTTSQVLLMWGVQRGSSVIPKSVNEGRIKNNLDLDGWSLSDEEMKQIDAIPDRFKVCKDDWLPVKVFFGDDE